MVVKSQAWLSECIAETLRGAATAIAPDCRTALVDLSAALASRVVTTVTQSDGLVSVPALLETYTARASSLHERGLLTCFVGLTGTVRTLATSRASFVSMIICEVDDLQFVILQDPDDNTTVAAYMTAPAKSM